MLAVERRREAVRSGPASYSTFHSRRFQKKLTGCAWAPLTLAGIAWSSFSV